jgi:hypothetical protein
MINLTANARRRFKQRITDADLSEIFATVQTLSSVVDRCGGKCRIRIDNVVLVINDYKVVTVYTNKSRINKINTWIKQFKTRR